MNILDFPYMKAARHSTISRLPILGVCLLCLAAIGCASSTRKVSDRPEPAVPVASRPVPAAEPERITQPPTEGVYHVVDPGQTLWRIASAYGVSLDELVRANHLLDADQLSVGQRVFIPGAGSVITLPQVDLPGDWIWPVPQGRVISYYGASRKTHRHQGVDIAGRHGDPVLATRSGRVVYSGAEMRGYGKTVIIDHGDGLHSLYAHNSALLVRKGQRVNGGQKIARVGRSGNASAEHCHLEIRRNDVPVNPLQYLQPSTEAR